MIGMFPDKEKIAESIAKVKQGSHVTLMNEQPPRPPRPRARPNHRVEKRERVITGASRPSSYTEKVIPLQDAMSRAVKLWCYRNDIITTEGIKTAVQSGELHYETVPGLGRKVYIRLCVALNILPVTLDHQQKHAQAIKGAIRLLTENGYTVTKSE